MKCQLEVIQNNNFGASSKTRKESITLLNKETIAKTPTDYFTDPKERINTLNCVNIV